MSEDVRGIRIRRRAMRDVLHSNIEYSIARPSSTAPVFVRFVFSERVTTLFDSSCRCGDSTVSRVSSVLSSTKYGGECYARRGLFFVHSIIAFILPCRATSSRRLTRCLAHNGGAHNYHVKNSDWHIAPLRVCTHESPFFSRSHITYIYICVYRHCVCVCFRLCFRHNGSIHLIFVYFSIRNIVQ